MDNDYPCSHSMDTCFFAVDRDGHVAIFETGSAGAVPVSAFAGEEAYDMSQQLEQLPRVEALYDPRGHRVPGSAQPSNGHLGQAGLDHPILMFLASLDLVRDEIAAGRAVVLPSTEGVAVLFQTLPQALGQQLHASGACLGCEWHFRDLNREIAERGLFCYSHLTDDCLAGPYGRVQQPAQPIHVDQLPPQLREAVKAMRFDSLCFAETPHIQPIEHAECVSWEPAFMDVNGTYIRPVPGREDDYAKQYEDLAEIAGEDNLHIEPPSGHPAGGGEV